MTRMMFDSTRAADIPAGSELVGGYVDGGFAWSAEDWARFPGRIPVRFAIFNDRMDAHVLDVEPGNNDAAGAVPWVRAKRERGEVPTVYCSSDAGPQGYRISDVRAACDAAGVERPLFLIAQWDNNPATFDPTGDVEIIGKQYANPQQSGGHFDKSIVANYWPGVDAPRPITVPGAPVRIGQSADLTGAAHLRVGEVAMVVGIYEWMSGQRRSVARKVIGRRPGRYILTINPPTDPDTDETLELSAEPTLILVDVAP